jgi:hypothetical protein
MIQSYLRYGRYVLSTLGNVGFLACCCGTS